MTKQITATQELGISDLFQNPHHIIHLRSTVLTHNFKHIREDDDVLCSSGLVWPVNQTLDPTPVHWKLNAD